MLNKQNNNKVAQFANKDNQYKIMPNDHELYDDDTIIEYHSNNDIRGEITNYDAASKEELLVNWESINTNPEKHKLYAIQYK